MKLTELEAAIEAVLFAAGEAVGITRLASVIEMDVKNTRKLITSLADKYEAEGRGLELVEIDDCYQLCSNKKFFSYISKYAGTPRKKQLTQTLLETLAIIAYKQPITKASIEDIRGVNADHSVNKLIEFGLIVEKGRANTPGRPILFGTSEDFLRAFGLSNLSRLPMLSDTVSMSEAVSEAESEAVSEMESET